VKEVTGQICLGKTAQGPAQTGDEDEGSSSQEEAKRTRWSVKIEESAEALRVRHSPDIFPSN
jgi:hypothetical protein